MGGEDLNCVFCAQNTTAATPRLLVTPRSVRYGSLLAEGIMYSGMWTGANGNLTVVGFVYAQTHLYTLTLSHIHTHIQENTSTLQRNYKKN